MAPAESSARMNSRFTIFASSSAASKIQFHSKLDFPPSRGAARQFTKGRIIRVTGASRRTDTRERRTIRRRQKERRRVREVEKFRAQLDRQTFRDPRGLHSRKVRVFAA